MKAITGLCRADRGEVRIHGFNAFVDFEKAMARVGCVIETCEAYEYMSAYRNLEQVARFYEGVDGKRIEEVLEITGLGRYKHDRVGEYSLGMKQRLGLAAAILSKPELVILDEPANGLDIEGTVDIRNIIKSLASEQGITFFVSSHLIHEMELMCTRVAVVYEGRLIGTDTVKKLLENHPTLEDYFMARVKENRRRELQ
jgi:ABC-2 type transport system ATP-binding protein